MQSNQNSFKESLQKLKPGMKKPWLYFLAGAMWAAVGILLNSYVYQWIIGNESFKNLLIILGGVLLALTIYFFGFSKFADKNIQRVKNIPSEKPCVFAFQQWSSYPLVIFMISLGIYLRKYSPFPKDLLAIMYMGIGGSLFIASSHYFRSIFRDLTKNT